MQVYPRGQSAASEAKPVRNNVLWKGSTIPVCPRGKPSVFHSDTHGWTEVRGMDAIKSACASDLVVNTTAMTAHERSVKLEGKATAGSMGVLTTHNAVHWTRMGLLNQGGPLTVADISHHFHLRWPRGPLSSDIMHPLWCLQVGKWSLVAHNEWNRLFYKKCIQFGDMIHMEVKSTLLSWAEHDTAIFSRLLWQ